MGIEHETFSLPKRDGPNYHNMMAIENLHKCPDKSFTIVVNRRAKELGQENIYTITCNQCGDTFITLPNNERKTNIGI